MKRTPLILLVAVALAGASAGQVIRTQDGRALDANYQVGSGGYNSLRQASGFDPNQYVTGQVTGGREFRGGVPYSAADQLSIALPSAGLDGFLRSSVGVPELSGGVSLYRPEVYLSPYSTVLGPQAIAEGHNAPGTSVPQRSFAPQQTEQARELFDSAVSAYRPILTDISPQLVVDARLAAEPTAADVTPLPVAAVRAGAGAVRPAASSLFGIVREKDRRQIAAELTETERYSLDRRVGLPLEPDVRSEPEQAGPIGTPTPGRPSAEPPRRAAGGEGLPAPGESPYFDLLVHLAQMRREVEQAAPQPAAEPESPAEERPAEGQDLPPGLMDEEAYRAWQRRQAQESVERVRDQLILHSFTGTETHTFGDRMRRAEKLLKEGKYYDAAEMYEVAIVLNRSNPLASLGAALSLLGANEPLTAAYHLRRAMSVFPPLMETRVAVKELMKPETVDERLRELDRRIAKANADEEAVAPEVVFLAAWLRQSMGQADAAKALAGKLKGLAGDDKLLAAYAEVVLSGKAPAGAPLKTTTAPGPSASK